MNFTMRIVAFRDLFGRHLPVERQVQVQMQPSADVMLFGKFSGALRIAL